MSSDAFGESDVTPPESEAVAWKRMDCVGTWESLRVPVKETLLGNSVYKEPQ
ncbi:MAG: hypothetical protein GY940_23760 [bacterium]|nr:hypothetical protein [bacterium]